MKLPAEHRLLELTYRRIMLVVFAAVAVVTLLNVVGQRTTRSVARSAIAELRVEAPARIRGGLLFQGKIEIVALHRISYPRLVLGRAWTDQQQINTIEPTPTSESSSGGKLVLGFDAIDPGRTLDVWLQFQANPTGAGRRDQSVWLYDRDRLVARVSRKLTEFP
jgi:hypothetical protein